MVGRSFVRLVSSSPSVAGITCNKGGSLRSQKSSFPSLFRADGDQMDTARWSDSFTPILSRLVAIHSPRPT